MPPPKEERPLSEPDTSISVVGTSTTYSAVTARHLAGYDAIEGRSHVSEKGPTPGCGVRGETWCSNGHGVIGVSHTPTAGVAAVNSSGKSGNLGLLARGEIAGRFEGSVDMTQNLRVEGDVAINGTVHVKGDLYMDNADFAEEFDTDQNRVIAPGTVVILGESGAVQLSDRPFDTRVAGVVSGAGSYKPALTLDKRRDGTNRVPIALMGKTYCKVDARFGSIKVGDLLTTSETPGYAMKLSPEGNKIGCIIGKALANLEMGQSEIPILVTLQ